jgi:hypothetical protein
MPYGIIKVDTITFTDAGVDKSIQISGLVQNPTFSGNVTCTGTISGVTVTGTVGAFTTVSGITVTGTTATFTSGNFTNISGGTYTITSGVFAAGSAASPSISFTGDSNTGLYSPGADQVAISTNGTKRLEIQADGDIQLGGSSGVFFDATNNRLGIGTTSPVGRLDVVGGTIEFDPGAAADSARAFNFNITGSNYAKLLVPSGSNGALAIHTGGANAASERARIDNSGRLLVGTSSSVTNGQGDARLQVTTNSSNYYTADFGHFSNDAFAGAVYFKKTRSTTAGGFASVVDGDFLGDIRFAGADGTGYIRAALIECRVDGTPGTNDMPGRLVFSTTADGASSPTERMRIAQNGVVTIQNGAVAVIGTLTDGATITPDLAADCNFTVTLGGARTIANPTNITAGQSGSIFLVQDGTGGRTASWGSYWDFPGGTAPTLSTAANAVDRVDYIVRSSTSIHTVFTANYS